MENPDLVFVINGKYLFAIAGEEYSDRDEAIFKMLRVIRKRLETRKKTSPRPFNTDITKIEIYDSL